MKRCIVFGIAILLVLVPFLNFQNNSIVITRETIKFNNLPDKFNGYKILQISDLHNKEFGKDQYRLARLVKRESPDLIVITGDLIDSRIYREDVAISFVQGIKEVAPIYYVTGNHEERSGRLASLIPRLEGEGVKILRNISDVITIEGDRIYILGVEDPASGPSYNEKGLTLDRLDKALEEIPQGEFKVLLAHRPEFISSYASVGVDLVFSGHAHGGQIRLPFIGGLVAPGQGILPKYTSGVHKEGSTSMVVSRGLGNSIFPQRLFNRPELVIIELKHDQ